MTFEEFRQSLSASNPPPQLSPYLQALWYDGRDDWEKAHAIVQDINDHNASWVHAYLHRKEGDTWNADYWYARAAKKRPGSSLADEWKNIVTSLLS